VGLLADRTRSAADWVLKPVLWRPTLTFDAVRDAAAIFDSDGMFVEE
jgi:hypothetical protein